MRLYPLALSLYLLELIVRRRLFPSQISQESIIKIHQQCLVALFSLLALITSSVHAQQHNAAPRIDGFNVDEVKHLAPGTDLNFSIYGTPGGIATLRIAGAQRNLTLNESESGQYEGTYTISSRDNITAQSSVTGNLRVGNQVTSAVLSESLQAGVRFQAPTPNVANDSPIKIDRFEVQPSGDLSAGNELIFTLYGTTDGRAEVAIKGAEGKFFLQEVNSGEYTGAYTIKRRDNISANSRVTASLSVGEYSTTADLNKTLLAASASSVQVVKYCGNCGTVEAVNTVDVKGEGHYLGAIGGGVVGALLGSQVGGGRGKTLSTVAGAIGGTFAGRAIERNANKTTHYEVIVRLQNGGTQTASFNADPGYRVGDKVKIVDGVLMRE